MYMNKKTPAIVYLVISMTALLVFVIITKNSSLPIWSLLPPYLILIMLAFHFGPKNLRSMGLLKISTMPYYDKLVFWISSFIYGTTSIIEGYFLKPSTRIYELTILFAT